MSKPRLSVEMLPHHKEFLDSLPHGYIKPIYHALTDLLILMVRTGGMRTLGLILTKSIKLEDLYGNDK